jgi:hypothetical protein
MRVEISELELVGRSGFGGLAQHRKDANTQTRCHQSADRRKLPTLKCHDGLKSCLQAKLVADLPETRVGAQEHERIAGHLREVSTLALGKPVVGRNRQLQSLLQKDSPGNWFR